MSQGLITWGTMPPVSSWLTTAIHTPCILTATGPYHRLYQRPSPSFLPKLMMRLSFSWDSFNKHQSIKHKNPPHCWENEEEKRIPQGIECKYEKVEKFNSYPWSPFVGEWLNQGHAVWSVRLLETIFNSLIWEFLWPIVKEATLLFLTCEGEMGSPIFWLPWQHFFRPIH